MTLKAADVKKIIDDVMDSKIKEFKDLQVDASASQIKLIQGLIDEKNGKRDRGTKGAQAARFLRCLAVGKGHRSEAVYFAKNTLKDETMVKALGESIAEDGGLLIPEDMSDELIPFLREASVVRSMGVLELDLPRGHLKMARQDTGSVATYGGENQSTNANQPTFGAVNLRARKLTVIVPESNELLHDTGGRSDTIIRDDMIGAHGERSDLAFISGEGTEFEPKGLTNQVLPANSVASVGNTADNIDKDLHGAQLRPRNQKVIVQRPGWLLSPRDVSALKRLRVDGDYLYRDEMNNQGTILGTPFKDTTQIPVNLGSGSDESFVIYADFARIMIGDVPGINVAMSDSAAYRDSNGVVQAAFSDDQTVMRMIQRHDLQPRQGGKEIAVITGVQWGV